MKPSASILAFPRRAARRPYPGNGAILVALALVACRSVVTVLAAAELLHLCGL